MVAAYFKVFAKEADELEKEGRLHAAYYKYLEILFDQLSVLQASVFTAAPYSVALQGRGRRGRETKTVPDPESVRLLFQNAAHALGKAESLVASVVEIDAALAEALASEVAIVTSVLKTDPEILSPSTMFKDADGSAGAGAGAAEPESGSKHASPDRDKLYPMVPASRLMIDYYAVQYNAAVVYDHVGCLKRETAKNKSNAMYLAELRALFEDLQRLSRQRDGIDHVMHQALQVTQVTAIQPRVLAEQLTLLDGMLFHRITRLPAELEFAGWLGSERLLRAPNIALHREFAGFVSNWVAWEVLVNAEGERVDAFMHFVGVAELLAERSSYHMLLAVIRGLCSEPVLRLAGSQRVGLFQALPKRSLIALDRLQGLVLDGARQRALLSKAPAGCLPAYDAAYLAELLFIEPELQTTALKGARRDAPPLQQKFQRYVGEMERLRHHSHALLTTIPPHPSIQHYLCSRPFWSARQLLAHSRALEPRSCPPEDFPLKLFHRRYLDDPERLFRPKAEAEPGAHAQAMPLDELRLQRLDLGEEPRSPDPLLGTALARLEDPVEAVARKEYRVQQATR